MGEKVFLSSLKGFIQACTNCSSPMGQPGRKKQSWEAPPHGRGRRKKLLARQLMSTHTVQGGAGGSLHLLPARIMQSGIISSRERQGLMVCDSHSSHPLTGATSSWQK